VVRDTTMKYITLFSVILLFGCANVSLENTSWFSRYNKYSNEYYFGMKGAGSVKGYGFKLREEDDDYNGTINFSYLFDGIKLKIIYPDRTDEYSFKSDNGNKVFISDFEYTYGREWMYKENIIDDMKGITQNIGTEITVLGTYKKASLNRKDNAAFNGVYKVEVNDSLSIILCQPYDPESKRDDDEISRMKGRRVKVIGTISDKTYLSEPLMNAVPQTVAMPCFSKIRFIKEQ
jgi:hypothetical protein